MSTTSMAWGAIEKYCAKKKGIQWLIPASPSVKEPDPQGSNTTVGQNVLLLGLNVLLSPPVARFIHHSP